MACISCGRGLCYECISIPCCCSVSTTPPVGLPNQASFSPEIKRGRPVKPDDEITISAGRKRAAANYTIDPTADCEWLRQANCGGGKYPIVGCNSGKQKHRHHGPVKNTARNEEGNVHLICATCHNRWHAKNDSVYSETEYDQENMHHSPREATIIEMLSSGKS